MRISSRSHMRPNCVVDPFPCSRSLPVRTPSTARLREVFRLETERWVSNDWVVQYRGHVLQLKPQNRGSGPKQSKTLICEWEDGAVEVVMIASSTKIWC